MQDLIDERQVALFDALNQLSSLKVASDIEIPQLIVVGDQSSGKSSVLEAIARFHFPVHERLCTRFPTKLILRRSAEERTHLSIDPGASRMEEEKKRLRQFTGSLSKPDELGEWMEKAAAVLGVHSGTNSGDVRDPQSISQEDFKKFTDDVLIVEKYGPNLPLLGLVDLPGLFQTQSTEQDAASQQTVMKMVEEHIKSKRSVILLVVSARTSFHNHTGPATIQKILKHDPALADRVVGVITNPDQALSPDETLSILNGRLDSTNLKRGWHVVKNQDKEERKLELLEQRDLKEDQFFLKPHWQNVPHRQRGIKALRATLKDMLWTRTRDELPGLISEVQEKIAVVEARLAAAGRSRATDMARRQYLCDIARTFEGLTREASRGTYLNEPCKELHKVGDACRACEGFFLPFDDNRPESQDKRLRANVRSLSKSFALAMREFGKTEAINDSGSTTADMSNETQVPTQQDERALAFPAKDIIHKYYTDSKPKHIDRKAHEEWLATGIERWRGGEPQGEASEAVYSGLFEYQSAKWAKISKQNLRAVWEAVEKFINLALVSACIDEGMLQALRKHLIKPRLDQLEKASYRTMSDLLNCHGRGKTGFYDGFVDVLPMRRQAQDLTERLATLASNHIDLGDHGNSDELSKRVRSVVCSLLSLPTGDRLPHNLVKDVVIRSVGSILTQAFQFDSKDKNVRPALEATHGLIAAELKNFTAARVIEHVETYYEVRLPSFLSALANL